MSRIVIGYIDGKPQYRDLGPSNGASGPALVRGSLVVGESLGRPPRDRLTSNQAKLDDRPVEPGRPQLSPDIERPGRGKAYASDEDRRAGRRQSWRESSRRKRAA